MIRLSRDLWLRFVLLICAFSGCAYRNDPTIEMMQAEMRWLEDQVYMLEGELEQSCYDLCKCRQAARDRTIWEQATASQNSAEPGQHELAKPSQPSEVDAEPIEPAPISSQGMRVFESPNQVDSIVDPEIATEIPEADGVPVDAIPYEIVPNGPFTSDCVDCEPIVVDPESANQSEPPISTGDDDATIEMSPVTPDTSNPGELETGELPAPLSPQPAVPGAPDDREFTSPDLGSDLMPSPTNSESDLNDGIDNDSILPQPQPEPAAPDPGERPNIEAAPNGEFDARAPSGDRYSIRLQSHIESSPIDNKSRKIKPDDRSKTWSGRTSGNEFVDAHVTHIVMDAQQQKPNGAYATIEDHDLVVRIEPRNADGGYVELPAQTSVVVLDRNQSPENARIARWDFDAAEIATFVQNDSDRGIRLELNWPGARPKSDELFIFVRYSTIDGRKLEAKQRLLPPSENSNASASAPKKADSWGIVSGSPTQGWTVVSMKQSGAAESPTESKHSTVGYEDNTTDSSAATDWTKQRVAKLASGKSDATSSQADAISAGAGTTGEKQASSPAPQELPPTSVQSTTPILEKPKVEKPTWRPYR